MAGKKRPSSGICFLRDNERLREAIKARMIAREFNRKQLAEEVGLAPFLISNYLNAKRPYPSQWDVIRIARSVDLEVTLDVQIDL